MGLMDGISPDPEERAAAIDRGSQIIGWEVVEQNTEADAMATMVGMSLLNVPEDVLLRIGLSFVYGGIITGKLRLRLKDAPVEELIAQEKALMKKHGLDPDRGRDPGFDDLR